MIKTHLIAAVLAATALISLPALAQDKSGAKAGVLTCQVASGWGFVFGSTRDLNCTYSPASGAAEHYTGTVEKYGVDIGYSAASVIVWAVFAPSINLQPGALTGEYGGVQAGASVGVGAGANALLGGNQNTITLQPLSIEGQAGLNVAAGVGLLRLKLAS